MSIATRIAINQKLRLLAQQKQQTQQPTPKKLEEDDDDDYLAVLAEDSSASSRHYVDNVTPLISSVFTSLFAVGLLYAWVSQKELWVLVFAVIDALLMALRKLVAKHFYTKLERDDIDSQTTMQFLRVAHVTVMFIITKILYDIVTFLVLTSTMYWYNFIDVLVLFVFFAYIFYKNLY